MRHYFVHLKGKRYQYLRVSIGNIRIIIHQKCIEQLSSVIILIFTLQIEIPSNVSFANISTNKK